MTRDVRGWSGRLDWCVRGWSIGALLLLAASGAVSATTVTYTTLDPPGSTRTIAASINLRGDVAGNYVAGGVVHGFVYSNGTYATLD
jgi:hypothetical protein